MPPRSWRFAPFSEEESGDALSCHLAVHFHVTWQFIDRSEEGQRRSLAVFGKWQPPAGAEFKGFYGFADGGGGVAIIEADSAATLARTMAPFTPWLRFTTTAIVPIEEASGIGGEGIAFRDSVS